MVRYTVKQIQSLVESYGYVFGGKTGKYTISRDGLTQKFRTLADCHYWATCEPENNNDVTETVQQELEEYLESQVSDLQCTGNTCPAILPVLPEDIYTSEEIEHITNDSGEDLESQLSGRIITVSPYPDVTSDNWFNSIRKEIKRRATEFTNHYSQGFMTMISEVNIKWYKLTARVSKSFRRKAKRFLSDMACFS